jgi:hypothetical protein
MNPRCAGLTYLLWPSAGQALREGCRGGAVEPRWTTMGAEAKLVTGGEPCIRPDHGEWHLWVGQRAATTVDGGGAAGGGGEAPAQPWKGVWQGEEARRRAAGGGARWQRISGKKKWRRRHEVLGGGGWRQISGEKQSGAIGGGGCGTADGRQTQ